MTKSITYEVTVTPKYTEYKLNGKLHREDGPAFVYDDGYKVWFINGNCHREDGPAVVYDDGYQVWYINGEYYTEAAFSKEMAKRNKPSCAGKVVEIDGVKYTLKAVNE